MSYLDLGTHDQLKKYSDHSSGCGNSVGHMYVDNNVDDDDEPSAIHLLPNILIGTGKYCRSCKYHDKAVDTSHLTDNGYLITASAGNLYSAKILPYRCNSSKTISDIMLTLKEF